MIVYMFIHLVADYGKNDLAFAEVTQALKEIFPKSDIVPTSVAAFDTLSTGFIVGQLANSTGPERIIYHNTAPRRDNKKERKNNDGEPLAAAQVGNALVVGPNSGYTFSFIREKVYRVPGDNSGSQFRSRDIFPQKIKEILSEGLSGEILPVVPVPKNRLLFVDGYGNLKTSLDRSLLENKKVELSIEGRKAKVRTTSSAFAKEEGALVLTPGSSGGSTPYLEIFLRGGSAHELFGAPEVGAEIKIGKKKRNKS